jgi:DNA-binding response OmpR family regulator
MNAQATSIHAASLRLLLVEDDQPFGAALCEGLQRDGHEVDWLTDGRKVEAMLVAQRYDVMLLDLGLPDTDGQQLLRAMRQRRDPTRVIVISARGDRNDRIGLLDLGADDYLVKPIDLGELEARLRAVSRRGRVDEQDRSPLVHGGLRLDPALGTVVLQGRRLQLRERERNLLELFLRDRERTFSRPQLEAELYGDGGMVDSNAIEVYVHYLRRKVAADVIVTVRGQGYRLGPPPPETPR